MPIPTDISLLEFGLITRISSGHEVFGLRSSGPVSGERRSKDAAMFLTVGRNLVCVLIEQPLKSKTTYLEYDC